MTRRQPRGHADRRDDEGGFVIVLVALTMVVSLTFVAFAVDLGAGLNERRQDQTAADAAALAAVQMLPDGIVPATEAAIDQARKNLRQSYTDAEWLAMWRTCTDSQRPAGYKIIGSIRDPADTTGATKIAIPCVSFNPSMARVRVRTPSIEVDTSFAAVVGVKHLATAADAEAEVDHPSILPFGLLVGGGSASVEECLKGTANGQQGTDPCGGSSSGNFGSIDSPLYGSVQYGTTTKCTGDVNGRLMNNMIVGIDHEMDEWREAGTPPMAGGSEVVRLDGCTDNPFASVAHPNTVNAQAGIGSNLDDGMLHGTAPYSGGPARLRRTKFETRSVAGVQIDDRPLWKYIPYGLTGVPTGCTREYFDANPTKAAMSACLSAYVAQAGTKPPLFSADTRHTGDGTFDIEESARFAFVPQFWSTGWGSGTSQPHNIKSFRPVFLQTLYFCQGGNCAGVNPADSASSWGGLSNTLDAITAFVLTDQMMPYDVIRNGPGARMRSGRLVK